MTGQSTSRLRFAPLNDRAELRAVKARIYDATKRLCNRQYSAGLMAAISTGSLARNEATVLEWEGGRKILGDAEFVLVFREQAPLPSPLAIRKLAGDIEAELRRQKVQCRIGLTAAQPRYFRNLPRHIYTYELKTWGEVISGDSQVLRLIPSFPSSDILLEDAWRLLCNRMIEHLDAFANSPQEGVESPEISAYSTVKLYLDMATSFLVFSRAYEPNYRNRAEKLRAIANTVGAKDTAPFPLAKFADRVTALTRFKLGECSVNGEWQFLEGLVQDSGLWAESFTDARKLWRWELERLTGNPLPLPDRALMAQWMQLQPARSRLRGWLHVVRQRGWHRSMREWPRWVRLACQASPRHWVYATAGEFILQFLSSEFFFDQSAQSGASSEEILKWLPEAGIGPETEEHGWQQLARAIVRNYHEFLEGTRA